MKKRLICLICTVSMLFTMNGTSVLSAGSMSAVARSSELSRLEDELATATANREEAEKALDGAEDSYADALAQKQAVDLKIYSLDVEIEAMEALISGINTQIEEKNSQIAEENAKLEDQLSVIRNRMRAKHEDGGGDIIAILLEADGLSDFFARIDRYMCMLDYDRDLLESYKSGITELETLREELEVSKRELNMRMLNLEARREDLEKELDEASELVESTESDITSAEEYLKKVAQAELECSNKREELLLERVVTTNEKEVESDYIWPMSSAHTKVTSGFGWRIHPVTGKKQHHNGIDIPAPYGTDIMAINDGEVIECSYNYADGYYITVSHGGGVASFYSHLSRYRVSVGDKVTKGQVIANVGTSGYVTGAHLNLNIYKNNVAIDPLSVVDPKNCIK